MGEQGLEKGWEQDVDRVLCHQSLLYILNVIWTQLISRHYDDLLAGDFDIKKIQELIARKYYWLTFKTDIKSYIRGCNVCLALKSGKHKLYDNLQSLLVLIYQ